MDVDGTTLVTFHDRSLEMRRAQGESDADIEDREEDIESTETSRSGAESNEKNVEPNPTLTPASSSLPSPVAAMPRGGERPRQSAGNDDSQEYDAGIHGQLILKNEFSPQSLAARRLPGEHSSTVDNDNQYNSPSICMNDQTFQQQVYNQMSGAVSVLQQQSGALNAVNHHPHDQLMGHWAPNVSHNSYGGMPYMDGPSHDRPVQSQICEPHIFDGLDFDMGQQDLNHAIRHGLPVLEHHTLSNRSEMRGPRFMPIRPASLDRMQMAHQDGFNPTVNSNSLCDFSSYNQ